MKSISKEIWSVIFKHLKASDFLNVMLTEKNAYKGFNVLYSCPKISLFDYSIYTGYDIENYDMETTGFERSVCQLCNITEGDEIRIFYKNPFSTDNMLSSPCCGLIMCPNCPIKDEVEKTLTISYMFIKNVIFLQEGEDEPSELINDDIQYSWRICKAWNDCDSLMSKYEKIEKNYNSYTDKKIRDMEETDICANCVCKNCGFECSVRNYMDS